MNVLVTSAGRRDYLIESFRATPGVDKVVAVDGDPDASALRAADVGMVVPPFRAPEYVPRVLQIVRELGIRLLVTVHDHDALVLAPHVITFATAGCLALVPPPDRVLLVMDKLRLSEHCRELAIPAPLTFSTLSGAVAALEEGRVAFPLIVKPRTGSASYGISIVSDMEQLRAAVTLTGSLLAATEPPPGMEGSGRQSLVQEHISGTEYGIDVVNDPGGTYVATLARRKVAMRSGETDKAVTVRDDVLDDLGRRLGEGLGHVGCLDCDVMVRDGVPYLLDANPRLGGGYPFVHAAGSDLPRAYAAWARGKSADPSCFRYRTGLIGAKSDRVVVTRSVEALAGTVP